MSKGQKLHCFDIRLLAFPACHFYSFSKIYSLSHAADLLSPQHLVSCSHQDRDAHSTQAARSDKSTDISTKDGIASTVLL